MVQSLMCMVKWFDPVKGYGFLVPVGGGGDVLIHQSCLQQAGLDTAYQGATIHCEASMFPKGLQTVRIISVDNSTAITDAHTRHPQDGANGHRIEAAGDYQSAAVKWFNRVRGYGFVTVGTSKSDIFLHMEIVRRCGIESLEPGQAVQVRIGQGPKGQMVAEIKM